MPPLNRVVAFAGPYISLAAGSLATYLFAKLNVLGVPGLTESNLATDLAAALTFGLTTVVTWLGQSKWLTGHQVELARKPAAPLGRALTSGKASEQISVRLGERSPTIKAVDREAEAETEELVATGLAQNFDEDPDMGDPLDAGPDSYEGDPKDKAGSKDHPA